MPATPFVDLPIAENEAMPWDADAAEASVRRWASSDGSGDKDTMDWPKYRKAFFWYDSDNAETFTGYKLGFAQVISGRLYAVPRGVFACAAVMQGSRGGVDIPAADVDSVKRHIARYYEKMDRVPPWQTEERKLAQRQYRNLDAVLAPATASRRLETDYYVEGYATTFNQLYVLFGDYREEIARGALSGADLSDVIMQYDHTGRVLARVANRTLLVEPDSHGLFVAADLSKSEAARQMYEEIAAGLVTRMSWGFTFGEEPKFDPTTRTFRVSKVKKVYDVSAVSIPANDTTEISARSYVDGVIDAMRRESLARKRKALSVLTRI